ncbi:YbaB/EbfC family nucleoid-associated protein [Nocardia sp. NPDC051570]|uniref:YbaB/EbfC family nucleoid-associated protein n=1 Tax=Nocardia sp. NPDC051570 TaxID=3364324 RepID=UPI003795EDF7
MSNERLKADAAMMMEALSEQMSGIAEIQRNRARLTATVSACDKRIFVTVNADGILIETKFADDVKDLSYEEIAVAMTQSVQAAAQKVQGMARELMEPLRERKARLPRLSEMLEGAPDLGSMMPTVPPVSTAPPGSRVRHHDEPAPAYENVEDFRSRRSMINDTDR